MNSLQQFINYFNKPKNYLILGNVFLVFFLIILNNLKIIPLRTGDFVFFAVLTLAFALYRPGWAFLFFIGTVSLENINLAPENLGIIVRPYQLLGALVILAVLARLFTKRLNFALPKLNLADYAVIVMTAAGFVSAAGTKNFTPLRLAVIFASFAALYFLVRIFIQNLDDLKKIIPFFLSSSIVVTFYGIWQNWAFSHNLNHFEAMPGRPNATFAEADWLGLFMVLVITGVYALIYRNCHSKRIRQLAEESSLTKRTVLYLFLTAFFLLLILTVSRSAWLGVLSATIIFLWIIFTNLKFNPKNWRWQETFNLKLKIVLSLIASIAIVYIFNLTSFQLFNRIQSTGTGLQKITVACDVRDAYMRPVPREINDASELEQYACHHINLEDIEKEKAAGNIISEVYRKDPNVNIRVQIYQKSWQEIKSHPILGIGWGNINKILGTDERGTPLNSSNIFLEIWLGTGILGILAFVTLLGYILYNAVKNFFWSTDETQRMFHLFVITSWFGIVVFNLFNAGIFLGFFWAWLGISVTKYESNEIRNT